MNKEIKFKNWVKENNMDIKVINKTCMGDTTILGVLLENKFNFYICIDDDEDNTFIINNNRKKYIIPFLDFILSPGKHKLHLEKLCVDKAVGWFKRTDFINHLEQTKYNIITDETEYYYINNMKLSTYNISLLYNIIKNNTLQTILNTEVTYNWFIILYDNYIENKYNSETLIKYLERTK